MLSAGGYIFDPDLEGIVKEIDEKAMYVMFSNKVSFCMDDARLVKADTRRDIIRMAHLFGYKVIVAVMPIVDRETSVQRRLKDPHGDYDRQRWEDVWEMFREMSSKPLMAEGFDKIVKVKHENTK